MISKILLVFLVRGVAGRRIVHGNAPQTSINQTSHVPNEAMDAGAVAELNQSSLAQQAIGALTREDAFQASRAALVGSTLGKYRLLEEIKTVWRKRPVLDDQRNATSDWLDGSLVEVTQAMIPQEDLQSGKKQSGFQIGRLLGMGSFGATFKAKDTDTGGVAALKFLYKEIHGKIQIVTGDDKSQYGEELDDLEKECYDLWDLHEQKESYPEGAKRVIHCQYLCGWDNEDCPQEESQPWFIVMDYGGDDGEEWLSRNSKNKEDVRDVLQQVSDGLAYLSEHLHPPLVHHDLKWGNIAVKKGKGEKWTVHIIDVGGAMRVNVEKQKVKNKGAKSYFKKAKYEEVLVDPTHTGRGGVSTPGYAPPEWGHGHKYDWPYHSFDMYSLGAMALEGICDATYAQLKDYAKKAKGRYESGGSGQYDLEYAAGSTDIQASCSFDLAGRCRQDGFDSHAMLHYPQADCFRHFEFFVHPDPEKRPLPSEANLNFLFTEIRYKIINAKSSRRLFEGTDQAGEPSLGATSSPEELHLVDEWYMEEFGSHTEFVNVKSGRRIFADTQDEAKRKWHGIKKQGTGDLGVGVTDDRERVCDKEQLCGWLLKKEAKRNKEWRILESLTGRRLFAQTKKKLKDENTKDAPGKNGFGADHDEKWFGEPDQEWILEQVTGAKWM